jgi:hypothetical protein
MERLSSCVSAAEHQRRLTDTPKMEISSMTKKGVTHEGRQESVTDEMKGAARWLAEFSMGAERT